MSRSGGFLRGPWFQYDRDLDDLDDRIFNSYTVAWGEIVKDPQDAFQSGGRSIRFAIKTGRGAERTDRYLVCVAWGDGLCATVMRAMERGDYVFVAGRWVDHRITEAPSPGAAGPDGKKRSKKEKRDRRKKKKPWYELRVSVVIPMEAINALVAMCGTPQIMNMVEAYQNAVSDPWLE